LIIWIDAQLSPVLASWITTNFSIECRAIRKLGLLGAKDRQIFHAARQAEAIVMTKDSDFLLLLDQLGPPPQILWITCGNTSNSHLKEILKGRLAKAVELFQQGEPLVEISDAR
jgi:predicted nuclease of predicted toxin-antitoxin system